MIFVHDRGRLVGIGECVLLAADRGGDKSLHQIRLGRERGVGRHDAVAVEAQTRIEQTQSG